MAQKHLNPVLCIKGVYIQDHHPRSGPYAAQEWSQKVKRQHNWGWQLEEQREGREYKNGGVERSKKMQKTVQFFQLNINSQLDLTLRESVLSH